MENCPERETLEKFLNFELTEEMNENILLHLSLCDNCRNIIGSLISEEKNLIKLLLAAPTGHKQKRLASSEQCLSKGLILAYASHCLNEDQLKLVESHLENCDNCLNELINLQKALSLPADLKLDISGLRESEDVLEIILKAKDNLLDLIRHTGELLSLKPQLGAVRGKEPEKAGSIIIRKDFKDRDLSIEITIDKEMTESGGVARLSIMKLSTEEFLSGIDVALTGEDTHLQGITNKEGVIEFSGIRLGKYDIKIAGESVGLIIFE